ncbi:pyridoxamine 5'-phosphate oxidase family protein [Robertmurraya kyonggiensis]|uniref:Pyridoxamine 5-phosphate oxidase n=1 Tax=Robertmurraya kyonggiensis TaxID=1037680 RepID=A0A4V5P4Z8_9BACI|nr:pyridoxamine 5'-phosphate oxidase family protein [Robertmurraya kyonggiensis]TKC18800.1 pyridoxamine 5-phosphate oxidase [Robertmurraya kyonggiensis]
MTGYNGERHLQQKYNTNKRAEAFYANQMIDFLNDVMKDFMANQKMVFISTADSKGECDSSFRAGDAGFVRFIDRKTLCYPEYRGNGVMASLGNISENPHIGVLFIDFEKGIGLHVNGNATIVENNELKKWMSEERATEIMELEGNRPERWVFIDVEEAYIHCSKHIPKLQQVDKEIHWGTDDEVLKGGDYFKVKAMKSKSE